MRSDCAIIMMRAPVPGKVKTRLSAKIGDEMTLKLYRAFVLDLTDLLRGREMDVFAAYHPPEGREKVRELLPEGIEIIAQEGEDLGERQVKAMEKAFDMGYEKVLVISADSPDVPVRYIDLAIGGLDGAEAVMGPSTDGGYYLLGAIKECPLKELLTGIEWGTDKVADKVRTNALLMKIRLDEIPVWYDVDELKDLEELKEREGRGTRPRRTLELLKNLPEEGDASR